jgi:hypothetical protein
MRGDTRGDRKTYTPPRAKRLNKDESRLLLERHAQRGDKGAKELLELLREQSEPGQTKIERKKAG